MSIIIYTYVYVCNYLEHIVWLCLYTLGFESKMFGEPFIGCICIPLRVLMMCTSMRIIGYWLRVIFLRTRVYANQGD